MCEAMVPESRDPETGQIFAKSYKFCGCSQGVNLWAFLVAEVGGKKDHFCEDFCSRPIPYLTLAATSASPLVSFVAALSRADA
jgi:hypothetical protein